MEFREEVITNLSLTFKDATEVETILKCLLISEDEIKSIGFEKSRLTTPEYDTLVDTIAVLSDYLNQAQPRVDSDIGLSVSEGVTLVTDTMDKALNKK